jgi:hypothetical protein
MMNKRFMSHSITFLVAAFKVALFGVTFTILASCGSGSGGGDSKSSSPVTSSSPATSSRTSSSMSSVNNGVIISDANKTSHNSGQDCVSCHSTGGSGAAKGIFTAAGTVYKGSATHLGATVVLYLHNTNQIKASLPTDKNGNFYTNQPVEGLFVAGGPLVQGVDPVVIGTGGVESKMPGVVTNGSCNGCHVNGGVAAITAN